MRIYKVYFPIEDATPDEVFDEVCLYTAAGLVDFVNQAIQDEIFGQGTFTEFELDKNTKVESVEQALTLLNYDGYLVDTFDFIELK